MINLRLLKPAIGVVSLLLFLLPSYAGGDWLPFSLEKGLIVINVEIDGHPAKAMLDSGAMSNLIDSQFVENYGQGFYEKGIARSSGVNKTSTVKRYGNIPVSVYGSRVILDKVTAVPIKGMDLILGIGFFHLGILQIDYPNSRLRFLDGKRVDLKSQSNVSMKKARDRPVPAVEVVLGGEKAWLRFDTGNAGGLVLSRNFAEDRGLLDKSRYKKQIKVVGVNSSATYERYELDSVGIGPFNLDAVKMSVPKKGQSVNLNRTDASSVSTRMKQGVKTDGALGYDVLKHFVVTVDCKRYQMHLHAP